MTTTAAVIAAGTAIHVVTQKHRDVAGKGDGKTMIIMIAVIQAGTRIATTMTAVAGAAMADGSVTPVVMPKLPGVVGMNAGMTTTVIAAAKALRHAWESVFR